MKVYVLYSTDPDGSKVCLEDAFELEEKAHIYKKELESEDPYNLFYVEAMELKGRCDHEWTHYEGDSLEICWKCNGKQVAGRER